MSRSHEHTDPVTRFVVGLSLLAATCLGCARAVVHYDGIPGYSIGMTYCDSLTGRIRTVIDAQLLGMDSSGHIAGSYALPEILVHEAVHRAQAEARRPAPGVCPPAYSVEGLLQSEIQAYCTAYDAGLSRDIPADDIGKRYARALRDHLERYLGKDTKAVINSRWGLLCPQHRLVWDAGP